MRLTPRFTIYGGFFDLPEKLKTISAIQEQMAQPTFWDDNLKANKVMRELKILKSVVEPFDDSIKRLQDLKELTELSEQDPTFLEQILKDIELLEKEVNQIEIQAILGGEFDGNNAMLSINAGAGGTDIL